MPSFDIESKIDNHELSNAIDQTNRIITNRYDLKDANANVALQENEIKVSANESFQLDQIIPILKENLSKRKIDLKSLKIGIKSKKMKVQSSIQGDSVRVSGKKRDDLQAVITLIKEQNFNIPLQFQNFRD